jgi:hypothetical protein
MLHSKPSERVWFRRNDRARFVASESGRFLVMFDSLSFSLVLGPPLADARPSRREGEITRGNLCRHQCPPGEVGPSGPGEGNAVCQQVHCDARKDPLPPLRRRPPPLRGRGDAFCNSLLNQDLKAARSPCGRGRGFSRGRGSFSGLIK